MNWTETHPRIEELCKKHFDNQLYADSILTAMREINAIVKTSVLGKTGREYDGVDLMRKAFGFNYNRITNIVDREPIISFVENLESETNRNLQEGYMNIFVGAITAF